MNEESASLTSENKNPSPEEEQRIIPEVRSLKELIDLVSGRSFIDNGPQEESSIAEVLPFPFLALVGQMEMKLALLLTLINPAVGGVLLIGPRGTGKTTAVRSLTDIMPRVSRSACFYGCLPEDVESEGIDAICPNCAKKYAEGIPLTFEDKVNLIELPLNTSLEDVVGGLDDREVAHARFRLRRGILSKADNNILFVDEVNLLTDDIVDAILDAAAQGKYTIQRKHLSATYKARFNLIGSMNPEEGNLRPQILDRFGLRIIVRGLEKSQERLDAYNIARAYKLNPRGVISRFAEQTERAKNELQAARDLLKTVELPESVAQTGIKLIQNYKIDSLRAEIALFEAARAYAAADARTQVTINDLRTIAPLALRLRRSNFMINYFSEQSIEENKLLSLIDEIAPKNTIPEKEENK